MRADDFAAALLSAAAFAAAVFVAEVFVAAAFAVVVVLAVAVFAVVVLVAAAFAAVVLATPGLPSDAFAGAASSIDAAVPTGLAAAFAVVERAAAVPFAAVPFAAVLRDAALFAAVLFAVPRAVVVRAEFLAAAVRAAAAVVVLGAADRGATPSIFKAGSATTSTVAAAFSAAAFEGVPGLVGFFAGVFLAGVLFGVEGAASAT